MNQEKKGAPEWALKPFTRYLDEVDKLHDLFTISTRGIAVLRGMPKLIETLAEVGANSESDLDEGKAKKDKEKLENSKREAKLAQAEVDSGFPLLHAQALVAIWTLLEAAISEFLEAWIKNQPSAIQIDQIQKLQIRLGEYERHVGDSRFAYIVDQLEQKYAKENTRYGYERFEKLLSLFDLRSDIPPRLNKALIEFSQIRNCIVHKAGIVDNQLLHSCPWLTYKIGERIKIDGKVLGTYVSATTSYVTILICRVGINYGKHMQDHMGSTLKKWINPEPSGAD
jgi:hypothetical protein